MVEIFLACQSQRPLPVGPSRIHIALLMVDVSQFAERPEAARRILQLLKDRQGFIQQGLRPLQITLVQLQMSQCNELGYKTLLVSEFLMDRETLLDISLR